MSMSWWRLTKKKWLRTYYELITNITNVAFMVLLWRLWFSAEAGFPSTNLCEHGGLGSAVYNRRLIWLVWLCKFELWSFWWLLRLCVIEGDGVHCAVVRRQDGVCTSGPRPLVPPLFTRLLTIWRWCLCHACTMKSWYLRRPRKARQAQYSVYMQYKA